MKKFRVTEKNGASITYQAEQELDWTAMGHGLPERWTKDATEEQKAMALETRTVEVMGQEVVEYRLPSEYQIDVQDITAEVQAEKSKREAAKLAKEKRKAERKALDWAKINTVAELKAIVKNLVEDLED